MSAEVRDLRAKLERARDLLTSLEIRLAGVAPSERPLVETRDREQLVEEISEYEQRLQRLASEEPVGAPQFEFVNRARELEQLSRPTCPQYIAVEAPAGFGKTALLRKLQERLNAGAAAAQVCLYARVPRESPAGFRMSFVGPKEILVCEGRLGSPELLTAIAEAATRPGRTEFALLFDDMENLANSPDGADLLWRDFVLALERRLQGLVNMRVVFCGRRVQSTWRGATRHRLQHLELEPFNFSAVTESVQHFATQQWRRPLTPERRDTIGREVLLLSGGHPGAIGALLSEITSQNFALDLDPESPDYAFSSVEKERMIRQYVVPRLEEIFKGVDPDVAEAMQRLSAIRGFNSNVVAGLIQADLLDWSGTPTELLSALSRETWLVSRPSQPSLLYRDSIARMVSASVMRNLRPQLYRQISRRAYDLFLNWCLGRPENGVTLKATDHLQVVFALEALYHRVDLVRVGDLGNANLLSEVTDLTRALIRELRSSYGEPGEMKDLLYESLQQDSEFWDLLGMIGGDAVVDGYSRIIAREDSEDWLSQSKERDE